MRYLNNVQDLTLGSLYELDVTSWQARVPWFNDKNRTDHNCVTPPANGTYVVYLGKYAEHDIPYYRLLSSDGNMYRTYNTNFVHGLKETNKPRRKTTTKKIPSLTSVEEAMEVVEAKVVKTQEHELFSRGPRKGQIKSTSEYYSVNGSNCDWYEIIDLMEWMNKCQPFTF